MFGELTFSAHCEYSDKLDRIIWENKEKRRVKSEITLYASCKQFIHLLC